MPSRACTVCGQEFPRTPEFWHKHAGKKDGLCDACKECAKRRASDWHLANLERHHASSIAYRKDNRESVLAGKRRYRAKNLDKILAADAAWKAANVQKRVAYTTQWRLDNPEKAAALRARDYQGSKASIKQRAKDWAKDNPERIKIRHARDRAARRKSPGHFTETDLKVQHEKQGGLCFYCKAELENGGTVDHYQPLSKGGTNYPDNIVLACWPCNNRKRAKLPEVFLRELSA